jgi:hypothetical protein
MAIMIGPSKGCNNTATWFSLLLPSFFLRAAIENKRAGCFGNLPFFCLPYHPNNTLRVASIRVALSSDHPTVLVSPTQPSDCSAIDLRDAAFTKRRSEATFLSHSSFLLMGSNVRRSVPPSASTRG